MQILHNMFQKQSRWNFSFFIYEASIDQIHKDKKDIKKITIQTNKSHSLKESSKILTNSIEKHIKRIL